VVDADVASSRSTALAFFLIGNRRILNEIDPLTQSLTRHSSGESVARRRSIDPKLKQTTFVSPRLKCNISDSGKD
jgi:hypothetical protein